MIVRVVYSVCPNSALALTSRVHDPIKPVVEECHIVGGTVPCEHLCMCVCVQAIVHTVAEVAAAAAVVATVAAVVVLVAVSTLLTCQQQPCTAPQSAHAEGSTGQLWSPECDCLCNCTTALLLLCPML
jgi:hypothetical protein